jgi:hypothetical protein
LSTRPLLCVVVKQFGVPIDITLRACA